jgi:carboxypeptidase family protein
MERIRLSLIALFVSVLSCSSVWAQATAQLSGTVRDQSGAVLPGVEISATQTDTGITRTTISNETGSFILPNLPLGPYRLEASLSGFRTFAQTGIVLAVNSNPVINPVLEVGQVSDQIEVQANATMVETRNAGVSQVVEQQRILDLPLNGRQVTDLITLAGAAVQSGSTRDNNSGQLGGSPFIAVGGGLGFGVAYVLDGANHLNFINASNMPMPFPDALQEFKVETSGLGAQYGKETAVNSVTKSGTNEFHGDAFEFMRNDLFNARNYFATTSSTLKRHQFGGTVGGPIKENKLFFFAGYQGTTLRENPANFQAFLPTPSVLAGDWTAFTSPACNAGRTIALRAPFVNNRIDPRTYSPAAMNILSRMKTVGPEPCGLVTFGRRNVRDEHQFVGRIDHQLNAKQFLFGRYILTKYDIAIPAELDPSNLLATTVTGQDNLAQSFALGHTYLMSANTVNALRLSFNRVNAITLGPEVFSACDAGVKMYCGGFEKSISLNITGGFVLGSRFVPHLPGKLTDHWTGTSYQINDDFSLIRGSHQIGVGGSIMEGRHVEHSLWHAVGLMAFTGQSTNLGLADFLTGQMFGLTTGNFLAHTLNHYQLAMYATDSWKVNTKLALNYGLRWEPFLPQQMTNGRAYSFDYAKFQQGVKSTVFRNAPAGFTYIGDPGFIDRSGIEKRWGQFAPRVGLAWDVNGDGRTSVRASYAYGYDFVSALWREDYSAAAPWTNFMTVNGIPLDDPWRDFPGGNPFPATVGPDARFVPYTSLQTTPRNLRTPSTSSWNLSIQRQVAADWLVSASYIGTQASHIWTQQPFNPGIYIAGGPCTLQGVVYNPCSSTANINQRRRLTLERPADGQLIGALSVVDDGGTQSYNGLLLNVQRRAARGITVGTNYTLSHCIGDYADLTSQGPDANETYTIPGNRDADRGNCNADRRHLLNVTAVAETPRFANNTLRMLAAGWKLSGIYRWSAGAPITVIAGTDRALNGIFNQRADQVLANPYGDRSGRPLTNWLNPAAFALPALGTAGNVGRNSVTAPGTWSFDLALSRIFRVSETNRLEARAEAYNLTNSFRPTFGAVGQGLYTQSFAANTFGQIRQSLDPRILQFALKYVF